ncbi:MAG: 6-phosphofructokinase [Endomicrobia bacterium]|nr:6-phosphofructokinase [Endomicrobiia bacterium]
MTLKLAIITPGGDAPGMNAAIRAVVRASLREGWEVFGVYRGYQGLIEKDIKQLTHRSVSGIIHLGGTILKSSRCQEIKTEQGLKKAVSTLKELNIDYLVVIGGDGSIKAAEKISKYLPVICIPASIDNDVYGTDETIGFDTAIDTAVEAIDKIRDTATSFERVFVVEVMGREHGFLALSVAVASGAEVVIIPEIKYNLEKIAKKIKQDKQKNKTSEIIVFAEGAGDVKEFALRLEAKTGISTRVSSLGYIQRGGSPSARSRILASIFGEYAVKLIKERQKNKVVVIQNNKINLLDIEIVVGKEKPINKHLLKLIENLG